MKIRHKVTGRVIEIDDSPETLAEFGVELPKEEKNLGEKALGFGKEMVIDPLVKYSDYKRNKEPLLGLRTPLGTFGIENPVPRSLDEVLNQAEVAGLALGGLNPLSVAKLLKTAPKYLSKKGLASLLDEAYKGATASGGKISVRDIASEARASKVLPETIKGIDRFISENLPKSSLQKIAPNQFGEKAAQLTPSEAWDISKEISQKYGKSLFDWFPGVGEKKLPAQAVRNAISTLLKDTVPEAKLPTKLYSLYAKSPVGSPANALIKGGLGFAAASLIGKPIAGLLGGMVRSAIPISGGSGGYSSGYP